MDTDAVNHPHFFGPGPHIRVRNTFLDFTEHDVENSGGGLQRRSKTVPPGGERGRRDDAEDISEQATSAHSITVPERYDEQPLVERSASAATGSQSHPRGASAMLPMAMSCGPQRVQQAPPLPVPPAAGPVLEPDQQFGLGTAILHSTGGSLPSQMLPQTYSDRTPLMPPSQVQCPDPFTGSAWFSGSSCGTPMSCAQQAPAATLPHGAVSIAVSSMPSSQMPLHPQPQTLSCNYQTDLGVFEVQWFVDARKLRGNDKQAVSPPFELPLGLHGAARAVFKLMIYAKSTTDRKGGACFKKARGRGTIQLKCQGDVLEASGDASFRIAIGSGVRAQPPRGPIAHNFASNAVRGLEEEEEEWDFATVIDDESLTFLVKLEFVPGRFDMQGGCT